jgi:hypothetical protein
LPGQRTIAASRDGRTAFFAQGESNSSIVMAENFQWRRHHADRKLSLPHEHALSS